MVMRTDDHGISYETTLFRREQNLDSHIDWLWLKPGSGFVDILEAKAKNLYPDSDSEFVPEDGKLRRDGEWYCLKITDGASFYEDVVRIPAYYVD